MSSHRYAAIRLVGAALVCGAAACHRAPTPAPAPVRPPAPGSVPLRGQPPLTSLDVHRVVPMPATVVPQSGAPFTLAASAVVVVPAAADDASRDAVRVGELLARMLRPPTGFRIPVTATDGPAPAGSVVLRLGGAASLGSEGYELVVGVDSVRLTAATPAGLFHAVQTLRQLFPAGIEADQFLIRPQLPWTVPAGRITDQPRFAHRGAMLDVARHFFTVGEVQQLIDLLALYKLNTLHLHLTDDQGWRIQIDSWPKLTAVGGSTEVAGGPGGFYTKADYAEIVRYAQERFVTVVPEIDMPAHTNAAVVAYPELGCGRDIPDTSLNAPAPGLYAGIRVGFSALCHDKDATYAFIDDVVRELAAMTPGPSLHLGGDEAQTMTGEQYARFVERVQEIVAKYGKQMIGWDEIGHARLRPGTVAQMWRADTTMAAARQGAKLIISPATKVYLDMKYTPATEIGHRWAAFIELQTAYDWDPVSHFPRVTENDVLGVEAALWTETVRNITGAEYLILPRLPAIAELAWSPSSTHDWERFRTRIAGHAPRWRLMGANFYPSPQVSWEP
jgi:hexosaminidase